MRWTFIIIGFLYSAICSAQVIENPVFDSTDTPSFHIDKIEITKDTTFVYCTYDAEEDSWANISSETYLEDINTGKKYTILKSEGLPFAPQRRSFVFAEKHKIKMSFPCLGTTNKLNFVENAKEKAFNVYGIDISNQYNTSYSEVELKRFSNMASFYDSAGDTIKALQYKEKEIEATKYIYGIESEPLLVSLVIASIMYDKYGYYEQAISVATTEGRLHAQLWGTSDKNYALYLRTLASFYSNAGKHDMAIKTFKESIELFDSIHIMDNDYVLASEYIAHDYYEVGDVENALIYQKKSIDARREIGDADNYIKELSFVLLEGDVYNMEKRIELVIRELENLPNYISISSLSIARLYKLIADSYSLIKNNQKAIEYCERANIIMKYNGNDNCEEYAELLGLKCKYQQRNRQDDDAIVSGEAAKKILDSLNIKSLVYAEILRDLAEPYGRIYNYEKSTQLLLTASTIYENENKWISLAGVYGNIGNNYQLAEDLEKAELYIKKAIDVLYNHDATSYYNIEPTESLSIQKTINIVKSSLYGTLGSIYAKQGKLIEAIETEKENIEIIEEMRDNEMLGHAFGALSHYYYLNKQYTDAISCAERGKKILELEDKSSLVFPTLFLACIYLESGDTVKSIKYASEAVSLSQFSRDNYDKLIAQSFLSVIYYKKKDYGRAEECLSEALDSIQDSLREIVAGMTNEQKQRMWNNYQHYFLLYRKIIENTNRDNNLLSKLYDYVLFSKSLLLDSEIRENSNEISRMKVTWKVIQQYLSNEDIAIEFISTIDDNNHNTYHALIIDKDCPSPSMITLYSESDLKSLREKDNRDIVDFVGELIWKPIINQYSHAKNIYFSPDGLLHLLPIEYYRADNKISMNESYNMYRLSSTKEIVRKHNQFKHNTVTAVLYGGLDYNQLKEITSDEQLKEFSHIMRGAVERGAFEPLYNTLNEIQEINKLLESGNIVTSLYSGEKGTEDSFMKLSNQNISLIHMATHGMYVNWDGIEAKRNESNFDFLESLANEKDPVFEDVVLSHSFLVMSGGNRLIQRDAFLNGSNDGILTAKEVSKINLSGLDLVVLSACETALGNVNSEGVYGLQRGFKKAGANTIIMSLDKVDDEATKILMVEFYRNLMSGKTKHQSLKDAQKYLRQVDNGRYGNPKYWASFIMLDGLN